MSMNVNKKMLNGPHSLSFTPYDYYLVAQHTPGCFTIGELTRILPIFGKPLQAKISPFSQQAEGLYCVWHGYILSASLSRYFTRGY